MGNGVGDGSDARCGGRDTGSCGASACLDCSLCAFSTFRVS